MEIRKLCWVPNLEDLEDAVILEEWEHYYIDYYTSHYFSCANQVIETYWQDICKHTIDPDYGKIIVFKEAKNAQGNYVERAITPLYSTHIKKLDKLLSQLYYFHQLEQMDYYNYQQRKFQYERIILLEEYKELKKITDLTDPIQKQNFDYIQSIIYQRLLLRENNYEILRVLLSMKPNEWKHQVNLPPMGDIIDYVKLEEVDVLASEKQLQKKGIE